MCVYAYIRVSEHMYRNVNLHLLEIITASININVLLNWQCYTFLLEFTPVT